jgi:hypothetical protein
MATRTYRPETYVITKTVAAIAVDENFTIKLPAGLYEIAILTDTPTVLAVGTANVLCRAFANAAQTRVVEEDFYLVEPDEAAPAANLPLTIGDTSQYATVCRYNPATMGSSRVPLPYGLQVTYDVTGAMTGALTITVIASRVG